MRTATPPRIAESGVETTRFKCRACRQLIEVNANMMGSDVACPKCGATVLIPLHVFSINPFRRPVGRLLGNLTSIEWHVPFFPQLIEAVVLLFVALVTMGLYLTVGIASQVAGIFQSLMLDARNEIKTGGLVEKSAYAVAGGIYLMLWFPFWMLLLPFALLGWIWRDFGYLGLIILALLLTLGLAVLFRPELLSRI